MCVSVSGPADRPRGAERCNGQRECRRRARAWIRDAVPATPRAEREGSGWRVSTPRAGGVNFLGIFLLTGRQSHAVGCPIAD